MSRVALSAGSGRMDNLRQCLKEQRDEIHDVITGADKVLLKPNCVSASEQLASTHRDALDIVMDVFEQLGIDHFTVAESSAHGTNSAFEHFGYYSLEHDHTVDFVDLNAGAYETVTLEYPPHPVSIRVATPLLDDDTVIVSLARLKTHDTVVATLTIKNVLMGSIVKTDAFNDKKKMHQGYTEINHYLDLLATRIFPDIGIIDGYRGMEGNGPVDGAPVESDLAIASTDPLAADFVGLQCMEIDPTNVGYLNYISQRSMGDYDAANIDIIGGEIEDCRRSYRLHDDIEQQLSWKGT